MGMAEADLVVVQTFATESEANLAKSALEAADIESIIQADTVGGMRPHVAWASGGFHLIVRDEDAATAREILELPAEQA